MQQQMQQPLAGAAVTLVNPCRICDRIDGPDIIAPCLCTGRQQWVHRKCLDSFRAREDNPRAFTNCSKCGFEYRLQLQRIWTDNASVRRKYYLRSMGRSVLKVFLSVQIIVLLCSATCIYLDPNMDLVKVFNFPQEGPNMVPENDLTFMHAFEKHKATYYTAGLLVALGLLGVSATVSAMMTCCNACCASTDNCCKSCCGDCASGVNDDFLFWHCYMGNGDRVVGDCCSACCQGGHDAGQCCEGCCKTGDCKSGDCDCKGGGDNGGAFAAFLTVVALVMILLGIVLAIASIVYGISQAASKYARIKQLHMMAQEYTVEDLSLDQETPLQLQQQVAVAPQQVQITPSAPPAPSAPPMMVEHLAHRLAVAHRLGVAHANEAVTIALTRDLQAVYGYRAEPTYHQGGSRLRITREAEARVARELQVL